MLGKEQMLRCRDGFDFAVNFGPKQKHQAREIKPRQEDDDGTQSAIRDGVVIKEMHINTEANRGQKPADDADGGAWRQPVPMAGLHIRREVVDDCEKK